MGVGGGGWIGSEWGWVEVDGLEVNGGGEEAGCLKTVEGRVEDWGRKKQK